MNVHGTEVVIHVVSKYAKILQIFTTKLLQVTFPTSLQVTFPTSLQLQILRLESKTNQWVSAKLYVAPPLYQKIFLHALLINSHFFLHLSGREYAISALSYIFPPTFYLVCTILQIAWYGSPLSLHTHTLNYNISTEGRYRGMCTKLKVPYLHVCFANSATIFVIHLGP